MRAGEPTSTSSVGCDSMGLGGSSCFGEDMALVLMHPRDTLLPVSVQYPGAVLRRQCRSRSSVRGDVTLRGAIDKT